MGRPQGASALTLVPAGGSDAAQGAQLRVTRPPRSQQHWEELGKEISSFTVEET